MEFANLSNFLASTQTSVDTPVCRYGESSREISREDGHGTQSKATQEVKTKRTASAE